MISFRMPAAALCAACLLGLAVPARGDDVAEVQRLVRAGQPAEAMAQVDRLLADKPRDAQLRFLKGVLLSEAKQNTEAITVFTLLSEDYPELAEPYNNLAVLLAAEGQYEKARHALDSAVRANPAYAIAYANLGDVHARLAAQAYARAAALDPADASLPSKITQLQALFAVRAAGPASSP